MEIPAQILDCLQLASQIEQAADDKMLEHVIVDCAVLYVII